MENNKTIYKLDNGLVWVIDRKTNTRLRVATVEELLFKIWDKLD